MLPPRIALIGMMCSGKTTVGKKLADVLGWKFVDTDRIVESIAGLKIPEIFNKFGEKKFRELERKALLKAFEQEKVVVSTGGGAVLNPGNRRILKEEGVAFYLEVSIESLAARCKAKKKERPLLGDNHREDLEKLLEERENLYRYAGVVINAEDAPWRVVQKILYSLEWDESSEIGGIEKIKIGNGLIKRIREFTNENAIFFAQKKVFEIFRDFLPEGMTFTIPDGDRAKTLRNLERIYEILLSHRVSRESTVVSIGGGAASDVVGFAASTFKRGVKFVNVPTTLLSQVDAGIGGKNAVNFRRVKNVIGTFYHPSLVLIDPVALLSLDTRAYRQGFAEIVKSAIIGDPGLFEMVKGSLERLMKRHLGTLEEVIRRSVKVKMKIVEEDFRESTGKRKLLNLGHTLGHAYEVILGLYHGEAVAMGLIGAIEIGIKLGLTEKSLLERTEGILRRFGLLKKLGDARKLGPSQIFEKIVQDKKATDKGIDFVIPIKPGEVVIKSLSPQEIIDLRGGF